MGAKILNVSKGESNYDHELLSDFIETYNISPQKIAVIIGLLMDALHVQSLLIDKDQNIQIFLQGSVRKKTELDQMIDVISNMPAGDVWNAIKRR